MKKQMHFFVYFMVLFCIYLCPNQLQAAQPLDASYKVTTVWATAYQATVTLKNSNSTPTSSWTASFTLPQNQSLNTAHVSGGVFTVNGQNVTVKNPAGKGVIAPQGTATFTILVTMPLSGPTVINNLQAVADGSTNPTDPTIPAAPSLNAIQSSSAQNYTVSWNSVTGATSYKLQQSTSSNFTNPTTVAEGNVLSKAFTNQKKGTYYYRVAAVNSAGTSAFSNTRNITINPSTTPVPQAPSLNPIQSTSAQNYTVSWNSVAGATSYKLQQDKTSNFTNPTTVAEGTMLSKAFTNQAKGTYFYRVSATNSAGRSPFSNTRDITITPTTTPPGEIGIEHCAWYINWTSWFNGPTFVIPENVDVLNNFVGTLAFGADGKPTMNGFGNLNPPQLDAFVAYCAAQEPPVYVKASIGGGGGMYDRCWDLLTPANVDDFSQGLVDYCNAHGLIGVDFDYEAFASAEQEALVGRLIKGFKTKAPNLETSLCTNAGFGPNFPWQAHVKNILDAAMIGPENCAVDRMYIMSYYDPIEDEKRWVLGWSEWLQNNYGFTPARVSVGIDDYDAHAYDPVEFALWAISQGFSTAHWAFDPARPGTFTPLPR